MAASLLSRDENTVRYDLHLESAEDIASWSIIVFEPYQCGHGTVAKSIVLLKHKWVFLAPKHLLYWLQQISIHEVIVKMLVDSFIKDYKIANAMDADASSNHNRNVCT